MANKCEVVSTTTAEWFCSAWPITVLPPVIVLIPWLVTVKKQTVKQK